MRIWSLHPDYLDSQGLVALWRETLLAQKVLLGETRGYRNHPQLDRFKAAPEPLAAVVADLWGGRDEATRRGYRFDASKIRSAAGGLPLLVTTGQVAYELEHLQAKLAVRDPQRLAMLGSVIAGLESPLVHPLFRATPGPIEDWERL